MCGLPRLDHLGTAFPPLWLPHLLKWTQFKRSHVNKVHISKVTNPNLDTYIWLAPFSHAIHDYITTDKRLRPNYDELWLAYCDAKRSNGVKLTPDELKSEMESFKKTR